MFEKVKESLKQVIEISDSCPETYKIKCFEVLLEAIVREGHEKVTTYTAQEDKIKSKSTFFARNEITDEQWQKIFYFDGNNYEIIVNDLNENTTAKKQTRLALLLGIKKQLESNEPFIAKDTLVEICKKYSCYDSANFSSHMKKNKNWFLAKENGWNLTNPGQQEAVKVIKELAQ
jgi:hypothetical protein